MRIQSLFDIFSRQIMAQEPTENPIGSIPNLVLPSLFQSFNTENGGLSLLITNGIRLFFVVAGIAALFNFLLAGFAYMTSAGDSKKLTEAGNKIWYSLIGLILIVGSFALASFFGYVIFGRTDAILDPVLYTPDIPE
jgi:hypothetical protein